MKHRKLTGKLLAKYLFNELEYWPDIPTHWFQPIRTFERKVRDNASVRERDEMVEALDEVVRKLRSERLI